MLKMRILNFSNLYILPVCFQLWEQFPSIIIRAGKSEINLRAGFLARKFTEVITNLQTDEKRKSNPTNACSYQIHTIFCSDQEKYLSKSLSKMTAISF